MLDCIKRHIKTILFATALMVSIVFVMFWSRERVEYVDENGELVTTCARILKAEDMLRLTSGTYVVDTDITLQGTMIIVGDVNLIIADGCTLTIESATGDGIRAFDEKWNSYKLTIYGQEKQTGKLDIVSASRGIWCRSLVVNGAQIVCTTTGWQAIHASDTIHITRGTVTAESSNKHVSAIQGDKNVTICGGQVTAAGQGMGISSYQGDINLGYKSKSDFVFANNFVVYFGNVKISEGQTFSSGKNTYTSNTEKAMLTGLKEVKLAPAPQL